MSLNVTELDFDQIKANIINFLSSHPDFTDYDFTGSALNVLIDALAYSIHYQAVTANMSINEIFLDSAQLRNSIVSKAKELGYFPRQRQSAIGTIHLSITPTVDPTSPISVAKGTKFACTLDNVTYSFITVDDNLLTDAIVSGTYEAIIDINQGVYITESYVYDQLDNDQRFIIQQQNVDTRYMSVSVDGIAWTLMKNFVEVQNDSTIYYLQEVNDERVEVYFGDGILGVSPITNDAIEIEVLSSEGEAANGCIGFTLLNDIDIYAKGDFTLTNITKATGGADHESSESIKLLAPLNYQAQNRAVSINDYKALLLGNYGDIETISVWGGENNVPPQYGRVFVSVKPLSSLTLTPGAKTLITDTILNKYAVVGILPELVDPEYTYINIETEVTYDVNRTVLSSGALQSEIQSAIEGYFGDALGEFGTVFRFSKFLAAIDGSEVSVLNNTTEVVISNKFTTASGARTYVVGFNNDILSGTITSDVFGNKQLFDDGNGNLIEFVNEVAGDTVGVVNYATGEITIQNYDFGSEIANFEVKAYPDGEDLFTLRNNLLILGTTDIKVRVEI